MKIKAEGHIDFHGYTHPYFGLYPSEYRKLKSGEVIDYPDELDLPPGVTAIEPTPKPTQTDGRPRRHRETDPKKPLEENE